MNTNKPLIFIGTVFLIIAVSLSMSLWVGEAQKASAASVNFGGKVVAVIPCTCMGAALMIEVAPPNPGSFVYLPPASQLKGFMPPVVGGTVLGNALTVPVTCLEGIPPACAPVGAGLFVNQIGASL